MEVMQNLTQSDFRENMVINGNNCVWLLEDNDGCRLFDSMFDGALTYKAAQNRMSLL